MRHVGWEKVNILNSLLAKSGCVIVGTMGGRIEGHTKGRGRVRKMCFIQGVAKRGYMVRIWWRTHGHNER